MSFMRAFEFILKRQLEFQRVGLWCFATTPLLFLASVELIRRFAPYAAGTGIPQVQFAAAHLNSSNEKTFSPLISPLTCIIKIAAILLALWGGASTGREGPTVHIATCIFVTLMIAFRNWFGLTFDIRSAIVAGGAAGLAAAFNTPLAGVTFAIEELSSDYFSSIKDYVVLSIIFASLAAIWLTGNYSYFGQPKNPNPVPVFATILIGIVGGGLGAFFSTALIKGNRFFRQHNSAPWRIFSPVVLSWVVLGIALAVGANILGPGNGVAQILLDGQYPIHIDYFPLAKMAATLATYWSGIAGGIFAPCLSIGASLGSMMGSSFGFSTASCALVGMAAFLSGTIQAPITTFVIIYEMTGNHDMLIPVMLAALVSFMTARLLKADHLYPTLAENYRPLLDEKI